MAHKLPALAIGRSNPGVPSLGIVESWDGTNWSEITDMNAARVNGVGIGADNTSAIYAGGEDHLFLDNAELWNGSSWSEVGDLNTARKARYVVQELQQQELLLEERSHHNQVKQNDGMELVGLKRIDMSTARSKGAHGLWVQLLHL